MIPELNTCCPDYQAVSNRERAAVKQLAGDGFMPVCSKKKIVMTF